MEAGSERKDRDFRHSTGLIEPLMHCDKRLLQLLL